MVSIPTKNPLSSPKVSGLNSTIHLNNNLNTNMNYLINIINDLIYRQRVVYIRFRTKHSEYEISGNRAYIFYLLINAGSKGLSQADVPKGFVLRDYIHVLKKRICGIDIVNEVHHAIKGERTKYCRYVLTTQLTNINIKRGW